VPPDPPSGSEFHEVDLGNGRTIRIHPEDAAAIEAYRTEYTQRGDIGDRLATIEAGLEDVRSASRQRIDDEPPERTGGRPDPGEPQPPDPRFLIPSSEQFDPQRYHRENVAYIDARENRLRTELTRDHQQRVSSEFSSRDKKAAFERHFAQLYENHPELKRFDRIVRSTFWDHLDELGPLKSNKGFDRLAELSRDYILDVAKVGRDLGEGDRPPIVEGGAAGGTAVATGTEPARTQAGGKKKTEELDEKPLTITELIQEERLRKREAAQRPVSRLPTGARAA
jgi:hypothetical protein